MNRSKCSGFYSITSSARASTDDRRSGAVLTRDGDQTGGDIPAGDGIDGHATAYLIHPSSGGTLFPELERKLSTTPWRPGACREAS
jgi:hypothetical protein